MKKPSSKWGHGIASRCPPHGEQCQPLTARVDGAGCVAGQQENPGNTLPLAAPSLPYCPTVEPLPQCPPGRPPSPAPQLGALRLVLLGPR